MSEEGINAKAQRREGNKDLLIFRCQKFCGRKLSGSAAIDSFLTFASLRRCAFALTSNFLKTPMHPTLILPVGLSQPLPAKFFVTFRPLLNSVSVDDRAITFHELYVRYADDVYRFAYWLTGNSHDASDITSETFVRAWTAPQEPRTETVKAYLFTIARNLHRNRWRRQSRLGELDDTLPDKAAQPDEAAVYEDEFQRTMKAVQALPEIDRTVLLLRAEQDLSYEDIATATGLSIVAVRVRVFRARARLAEILNPKEKKIK